VLLVVALAAVLFPACSSKHDAANETLGDCVPTADAACTARPPGGGSNGGTFDGSADGAFDAGTDAEFALADGGSACGIADTFLVANQACLQCIQTNSFCCTADLNCTSTAGCTDLLQCVERCPNPGSSTCLASCPTTLTATQVYLDFALCLQTQCSACPVLPQTVVSDI
jgi:hypothetical protein